MLMSSSGRTALLYYGANGTRVLSAGDHVICAVTGERIPLEELRYWSVEKQQPYASAEIATRAMVG